MGWESNSIFQVLIVTGSTGSGVFVYSPSPGFGNLVATETAAAGTDPYGNAFLAGVASYGSSGGKAVAIQLQNGSIGFNSAATQAGPYNQDDALLYIPGATPLIELTGTGRLALANTGGVTVSGGSLSVGQGAAVQTLVNGSTINTSGISMQPVNCAAAVTGIILQPGTFDGQLIVIASNAAATRTITFAAAGTSNVSAGVAAVINPPLAMVLVWVASLALWFPVQ